MFRLSRAQPQPIGVDIGQDSIKLLQLQVVGNELEVIAAAKQAISEEVRSQPELLMKNVTDMFMKMITSACPPSLVMSMAAQTITQKSVSANIRTNVA